MSYPTISISLNEDRLAKLTKILRALRDQDETVSRSEAVGQAIDLFYLSTCPVNGPIGPETGQRSERVTA